MRPASFVKRVRTAFRADDDAWRALVEEIVAASRDWSREDWCSLPVRDRVALHCAGRGDREAVEGLAEERTVHGPTFLVDRMTRTISLGVDVDAPDWLLEVHDPDLVPRVSIEVAGSAPVVIAGTAFISGVEFDPVNDTVELVARQGSVSIGSGVTMRPDPVADALSGERWADQTHASWWTRLDLDRREPIELTVTVHSGGVDRSVEITVPPRGDADTVAVAAGDTAVELTSSAPRLEVASTTEDWGRGAPPLRLDAWTDRFGAPTPLPSGRYAVIGDRPVDLADPDLLTLPLAEREHDLRDLLVSLRGWSPGEQGIGLVVRNPIPVEHRGRRRQRLLLDAVRRQAGPLRERAVAMCFGGTSGGDSVAPIARELVRRGIPVDWVVTDHSVAAPAGTRPVLLHSREWHEAFTHARYLVNNAEFPHYVRFREGQRYLQTWHGTPLKRIGRDIVDSRLSAGYVAAMRREAAAWEALLAQNAFAARVLPAAFGFTGRVIVEGYPRNDALAVAAPELRARTREALGLGDRRVVLYAPTWRDTLRDSRGRRAFVSHLDAARVHAATGAVVLVRSHTNSAAARGRLSGPGVVDVTAHPDVTALMAAADVLVTDYSSIMFDFAVTGRPQILLVPDVADYRDQRGFYFDLLDDPPGPVVTDTDGVVAALQGDDTHAEARARFRHRFAPLDDGEATVRVVDAWLGPASER